MDLASEEGEWDVNEEGVSANLAALNEAMESEECAGEVVEGALRLVHQEFPVIVSIQCSSCLEPTDLRTGPLRGSVLCHSCWPSPHRLPESGGTSGPATSSPRVGRRSYALAIAAVITMAAWVGVRGESPARGLSADLVSVSQSRAELRSIARDLDHPLYHLAFRQLATLRDRELVPIAFEYIASDAYVAANMGFDALGDYSVPVTRGDASSQLRLTRPDDRIPALYALAASGDAEAVAELEVYSGVSQPIGVMVPAMERLLRIDRREYEKRAREVVAAIEDEVIRQQVRARMGGLWALE